MFKPHAEELRVLWELKPITLDIICISTQKNKN